MPLSLNLMIYNFKPHIHFYMPKKQIKGFIASFYLLLRNLPSAHIYEVTKKCNYSNFYYK